jgi:hypothetical protein
MTVFFTFSLPPNNKMLLAVFQKFPCFAFQKYVFKFVHLLTLTMPIIKNRVLIDFSGIVRLILSMKPVIALSRLTYCAFLCHGGIQLYSVATMRVPPSMSIFNLVSVSSNLMNASKHYFKWLGHFYIRETSELIGYLC